MKLSPLLCGTLTLTTLGLPAAAQCSHPLSVDREGVVAVSAGDHALFAGGYFFVAGQSVLSTRVDVYDGSSASWSTTELPQARWRMAATSFGNEVFFGGGVPTDPFYWTHSARVDRLDLPTGLWSTDQLSQARFDLAAAAAGGKVLFAGGSIRDLTTFTPTPVRTVDIYDTATGAWTVSGLSEARSDLAAAGVGSKVLFAGGMDRDGHPSERVDIYDTSTGSWSQASLSQASAFLTAASVGTKVLFAGAQLADIYDDSTGLWSTIELPFGGYPATLEDKVVLASIGLVGTVYDSANGITFPARFPEAINPVAAASAGTTGLIASAPTSAGPDVLTVYFLTADLPAPFCFGDGSGTPCPCGNNGATGEGCANSTGAGATLRPYGSQCALQDDWLLFCEGLVPNQMAWLFAGENSIAGGAGAPFGNGLRCAGGNLRRLTDTQAPASGNLNFGYGLQEASGWGPGDSRRFQVWYRDPSGPCGAGFNTSNGVEVQFLP